MKKHLLAGWLAAAAFVALAAPGAAAPQAAPAPKAAAAPTAGGAQPGAAAPASQPLMPEVISTYGHRVDRLFFLILGITLFMNVLVFALFGYFVVRYRYQEGRKVKFTHGNNKLEVFWTAATAAILIWLVFAQKSTWEEIKQKDLSKLEKPYLVRLFAEQFNWHFVYPGADGRFDESDLTRTLAGINPVGLPSGSDDVYKPALLVPEDVPVIVELNSLGKYDSSFPEGQRETKPVLHSFFQPNLRFKQDVVPYHPAKVWFQVLPNKRGTYEIACAELCGLGHYTMRADMKVLSDDELKAALGYDWKSIPASFEKPKPK